MENSAFDKAVLRREELQQKVRELNLEVKFTENEIAQLTSFINLYIELSKPVEATIVRHLQPIRRAIDLSVPEKPRKATGNSKKEEVAEAARAIIEARGEPVSRADLFKEIVSQGYTIKGTDPEMVLSTMLWRMHDRVTRLKSGGYWLTDKPSPDGSYTPPSDLSDLF